MSESVTLNVDPLSLATVGHGLAEQQFAEHVSAFLGALAEHEDALDHGGVFKLKDGCLEVDITVKVKLRHSLETGGTDVVVETSAKQPERRGGHHPVRIHGGQVLVEAEDVQPLLLKSNRRNNSK